MTEVVYRLEPSAGVPVQLPPHRLRGIGGVFMAKLLGHVRTKTLGVGLPPVLDDLDEQGALRPVSTLTPKPLR